MNNFKPKILFIIPSLRTGGAERVMSFLAANIDKNKFLSHLLVIGSEENQSYSIEGIPITFLNKEKVKQSIPALIKFLIKYKPDITISALMHLNTLMAILSPFFPKTKFIGRETGITGVMEQKENFNLLTVLAKLRALTLDVIICQSEDMKTNITKQHNIPIRKIIVINNPISENFKLKKLNTDNSSILQLITVGRLVKVKGHQRLLLVLRKLKFPFHYTIIGDGPEKKIIQHLINENKMKDSVTLINFTREVEKYLSRSHIFLQGSYSEGFPNALLESCAVGTPVIAFDCPGGTKEIIINEVNGFLASDENDFFEKLNKSIKTNWDNQKIRKSVTERFSKEVILFQYESLFEKLLQN